MSFSRIGAAHKSRRPAPGAFVADFAARR